MIFKILKLGGKIFIGALLVNFLMVNLVLAASIDFSQVDVSREDPKKKEFSYEIEPGALVEDVLKVENTSDWPIDFKLLAADVKIDDGAKFVLNSEDELDDGVGTWIRFLEEEFTVPANSNKEVKFSIQVPILADVGLHKGGILVQRHMKTEGDIGLNLQQGVPVEVKVLGEIVKSAEFDVQEFQDLGETTKSIVLFKNTGTVSLDVTARMTVDNKLFGSDMVYQKNLDLSRAYTDFAEFDWKKPFMGMYSLSTELVDNETGEVYAVSPGKIFVVIPYLEVGILILLILALIFRVQLKKFLYDHGDKKTINQVLIVALVVGSIAYVQFRSPVEDPQELAASITIVDRELSEEEEAANYRLVLRWGHLTEDLAEDAEVTMNADIILSGATLSFKEELSFDEDDEYVVRSADRVFNIESEVNDDFDGVVLLVQTDKNKAFNVAFEDKVRNLVHVYSIAELSEGVEVASKRGSAYTFGKAEMKLLRTDEELDSYLESSGAKSLSGVDGVLLTLDSATPDVSGKELDKDDTLAVLQNILSEDSATPDVDSSVSLNSDFVEEIVKSDLGSEVLASKEFISDLLATPQLISALAATANANVVFLPSDTIVFPKQDFSFEERKIASKVIGTLVFINKKDQPWNAYVSASNFEILAGSSSIPASNLSVVPGPIIPINNSSIDNDEIQRGDKHRLANDKDQAILVTGDADEDAMFIMRPRLELILPPATRSGVYAGDLTVTYIDRK